MDKNGKTILMYALECWGIEMNELLFDKSLVTNSDLQVTDDGGM